MTDKMTVSHDILARSTLGSLFVDDWLPSLSAPEYEIDHGYSTLYVAAHGIIAAGCDRLTIPLLKDFDESDLLLLLSEACKTASTTVDPSICAQQIITLANPSCNPLEYDLIRETSTKLVPFDFVPEGTFYVLPDREFLGCVAYSDERGVGALCIPRSILKLQPNRRLIAK